MISLNQTTASSKKEKINNSGELEPTFLKRQFFTIQDFLKSPIYQSKGNHIEPLKLDVEFSGFVK